MSTTLVSDQLLMAGIMVFVVMMMMNRQGGSDTAKAMNFRKSRAKMSTQEETM